MKPLLIALLCASLATNALLLVQARTRFEKTAKVEKNPPAVIGAVPSAGGAAQAGLAALLSPEIISQLKANDPAAVAQSAAAIARPFNFRKTVKKEVSSTKCCRSMSFLTTISASLRWPVPSAVSSTLKFGYPVLTDFLLPSR